MLKLIPRVEYAQRVKGRVWELRAANASELEAWIHTLTEQSEEAAEAHAAEQQRGLL